MSEDQSPSNSSPTEEKKSTEGALEHTDDNVSSSKVELLNKDHQIQELEKEIQQYIRQTESTKTQLANLTDLSQRFQLLLEEKSKLELQIQTITTESEISQTENRLLQSKIEDLRSELEKKDEQLTSLTMKIEQTQLLEAEKLSLAGDFERMLEEKHHFQQKAADTSQLLEEIQIENGELKTQLENLHRDHDHLVKQIEIKDLQIVELTAELEIKKTELLHVREDIMQDQSDSDTTHAELNAQLMEKNLLIDDLKAEIRGLQDKFGHMISQDELHKIQAELDGKTSQLLAREQAISAKDNEIEELKRNINILRNDLNGKIEELQEKSKFLENIETSLRTKEDILRDYEKQEEEFHEALLDNVRIMAEKEELQTKISELIQQKDVLFVRINELKSEDSGHVAIITRLEKKIADLQNQIKETPSLSAEQLRESYESEFLRRQVDDLNKQLREHLILASEASGKLSVIKDQWEQTNRKLKEVEDKYENQRQELARIERREQETKTNLTQLINDREDRLRIATRRVEDLEKELRDAKTGNQYQAQILHLKREIEEKAHNIEKLTDDLNRKNIDLITERKEVTRLNEDIVGLKRRIKLLRRDFIPGDEL